MKKTMRSLALLLTLATLSALLTAGAHAAYEWRDESEMTEMVAADFTVAVVTETQMIAENQTAMNALTQWIASNKTAENIRCAVHIGNTINMDNAKNNWPSELGYNYNLLTVNSISDEFISTQAQNFKNAFLTLTGAGIPYLIATGPEDNMGGYNRVTLISYFLDKTKFGYTGTRDVVYKTKLAQAMDVSINEVGNSYYVFSSNGKNYIILTLEGFPTQEAMTWASGILNQYSGHIAIVATGSYLKNDGEFKPCWPLPHPSPEPSTKNPYLYNGVVYTSLAEYRKVFGNYLSSYNMSNFLSPSDGITIWNFLIKNHANIRLVLDGGVHKMVTTSSPQTAGYIVSRVDKGVNGNLVYTVQANYSDQFKKDTGALLLMRFYDAQNKIDFTVYSPTYDQYVSNPSSRLTIDLAETRYPIRGTAFITGKAKIGNVLTAFSDITPSEATYVYEWAVNGTVVSGANTYTVTASDAGKLISVRAKGTGDYMGSTESAFAIPSKELRPAPLSAPVLLSKTYHSITVQTESGMEYRVEGGLWQRDGTFTRLRPDTVYRVYSRYQGTEEYYESAEGPALTVVTNALTLAESTVIRGDVNGDEEVNNKDAVLLSRYLNSWIGVTIDEDAADVNGDGSLDLKDLVVLQRFLAGWLNYDAYGIGLYISQPFNPPDGIELEEEDGDWFWSE